MAHVARALAVPLALALAACATPPTQVVVRLATDLEVPGELDSIRLEIFDHEGNSVRSSDLLELPAVPNDGAFHEVGTFGLVPRGGDSSRGFEVRAGARIDRTLLFTTRARSSFVSERTIRLDLYVPRLCIDVAATCQPDETCGVTGCVDPNVDPNTLPSHEEQPPADPTDPRGMGRPAGDAGQIRALHPLAGERVGNFNPTLSVTMGPDVVAVSIQYCGADPSCSSPRESPGTSSAVNIAPMQRRHYWRGVGERMADGAAVQSPVYWFETRPVDRGADVVCGMRFDWDGDTEPDLFVGAPGAAPNGAGYVYLGDDAAPSAWTMVTLQPPPGAGRFGSAAGSGDFDGDGQIELVVGAPDTADGGRAVVYEPDGGGTAGVALEPSPGGGITSRFGEDVATVGDVDGDGYADLAISGQTASGQMVVEIWRGSSAGLVPGFVTREIDTPSLVLAGGGDVDGDGYDDFGIGTPDAGTGGWAYLLRGGPDVMSLSIEDAVPPVPPGAGAEYGAAIAFGDVAGLSQCDVFVGAPAEAEGRLHLSIDGAPFETRATSGLMDGDRVGESLALPDLDGDGRDDLVSTRRPIRETMLLYFVSGRDLDRPVPPLSSKTWTMPDGSGVARILSLGDTGGAGGGDELVAAEIGFGVSLLTLEVQLGDFMIPADATEAGEGLR